MNFLKQLKKVSNLSKRAFDEKIDFQQIQGKLGDEFFELLNKTYRDRQLDADNSSISKEEVQDVIEKYANLNMAIAAASSFVPGPVGMLSAGPEMVLTVGNQMKMIYDMGCGFDKESFLNKDVLIEIPLQAAGIPTNLAKIQANPTDLIDSADEILKEKAFSFAKMSVDKMVKKSVTKWIPVGGSLVMAVWSKMSTNKIAETSLQFFDDSKILPSLQPKKLTPKEEQAALINRIKLLVNLIEADGEITENEIAFIDPIIKNSELDQSTKDDLMKQALKHGSNFEINFDYYKNDQEELDSLLFELGILTKRDGTVHEAEKDYLYEIADHLNMTKEQMDKMVVE